MSPPNKSAAAWRTMHLNLVLLLVYADSLCYIIFFNKHNANSFKLPPISLRWHSLRLVNICVSPTRRNVYIIWISREFKHLSDVKPYAELKCIFSFHYLIRIMLKENNTMLSSIDSFTVPWNVTVYDCVHKKNIIILSSFSFTYLIANKIMKAFAL